MTHVAKAHAYAADVLAGHVPACKWVRLACKRHEGDLLRQNTEGFPYIFDEEKAERVCKFMEMLPYTKGKWSKKNRLDPRAHLMKLEPWQCFILCCLFGWVDKFGLRKYNKASIYVPRKNGKSPLAAGIGWYMFAYDNEPGAEVYSGATNEKQAWEVFKPALQMAKIRPDLAEGGGVTVNASSMVIDGDGSVFKPVVGNPGDGASPHCAIVDEYHQHQTSGMYDTFRTGIMAREQPLLLVISTAGDNHIGPCRHDWKHCEDVLQGILQDETLFCIIFTLDDGDDWTTAEALRKANPNYGVSVIEKNLLSDLAMAMVTPRAQAAFKTKNLNLWVSSSSAYFNIERWMQLGDPALKLENFTGRPVFLSSDFAAKSDLTVTVYLFPGDGEDWTVFGKYYLPRATVELPENSHYRTWSLQGLIEVTEGDVTDMRALQDDVLAAQGKFAVQEWLFDPNRVYGVVQPLQEAGVPVIEVTTNASVLSKPMRYLDDMIKAGRIHHNGDPVLAWAISNVIARENRKDQIYPDKESREKKIDPVVALITAFSRAMDTKIDTGLGFIVASA
jgi:phage terminase large subunit-like protein